MQLRYQVSAVIGAAVLVTGAGSAVAFALAGHVPDSTETGNSLPIDDNHRGTVDRDLRVEPGDDRAGTTSVPVRATQPQPRPTPTSTDAPDDSDGWVAGTRVTVRSTDAPDDSDGRVRTRAASSAPSATSTDAPDDSDGRADRSGSGSGSDDDGDDDRSGSNSGSGSDDSGSDDSGSGGHGSDD